MEIAAERLARGCGSTCNTHHSRRATALVTVGIWLVLVAFTPPVIPKGDGSSMFAVAESIVNQGSIAVAADLGIPGQRGRSYSPWYPLVSVVLVPFVAAGEALARVIHMSPHYLAGSAALTWPSMLISANALVTIALALRLGSTVEAALWSGLAFVFGTIALVDAREILADPLLALLTICAIYLVLGKSGGLNNAALGLVSALAILAKPTGLIVGPSAAAFLLMIRRDISRSIIPIVGALIGTLLYLGYNDYRFGDPLFFGQSAVFRLVNVPMGLIGQLVSPGHGLFGTAQRF